MFKNILYFAILTLVLVVSWIGLSVYHSYTTSTISEDTSLVISPIPQEFDREAIEKIRLKNIIKADLTKELEEPTETEATLSAEPTTSPAQQL